MNIFNWILAATSLLSDGNHSLLIRPHMCYSLQQSVELEMALMMIGVVIFMKLPPEGI